MKRYKHCIKKGNKKGNRGYVFIPNQTLTAQMNVLSELLTLKTNVFEV